MIIPYPPFNLADYIIYLQHLPKPYIHFLHHLGNTPLPLLLQPPPYLPQPTKYLIHIFPPVFNHFMFALL